MLKSQITIPKSLILILSFLILNSLIICAQETIIDTLYGIPELDGGISYNIYWGTYGLDTVYGGHYAGDEYDNFDGGVFYSRIFLSFPLPELPNNYFLDSANIYMYQYYSKGNDEYEVYPIFTIEDETFEPPCLIEHLDYGNSLDVSDFNLSALHLADTLSTTSEQGWRNIVVTDWIIDDLENAREQAQSRLRLSHNYDIISMSDADGLGFSSSNHSIYKPYIVYEYVEESSVQNEELQITNYELSNYPNPFNPATEIRYQLSDISEKDNVSIEIFNIKGKRIKTLNVTLSGVEGSIIWNGTDNHQNQVSSGVYLYRLVSDDKVLMSNKMIMIK